jgi:hypothetical protein
VPNNYYISSDDLVLGAIALLVLWFVGYLFRLQVKQIRANRRPARENLRFGLIQEVTGSPRPKAARKPSPALTLTPPATATASEMDVGSKRWTGASAMGALAYHWN